MNVSATPTSSGQANLSWDAQSGPIRYNVKRSTTSGGPYTTIAPPPILTSNSYSDTRLLQGSTYFYVVSAINASGESPNSAEVSATVDNPVPAISSLSPANVSAGAAFVLTVNGSSFLPSSVVNLGGQPQSTTFVSSTQLTASIPANAAVSSGAIAVTVTNLAPGGGPSAAIRFTLDDFAISVPSASVTLSSGKSVPISVAVAPSDANGFANPIVFGVSGLPSGISAAFNPLSLTPGTNSTTVTLTLSSAPTAGTISIAPQLQRKPIGGTQPPVWLIPCLLVWLIATIFSLICLRLPGEFGRLRRRPRLAFSVMLLCGLVALCGCAGGNSSNPTMPPSPGPQPTISHVIISASSGTDTKSAVITLAVQ
jgi:hypothetical protein